MMALVVMVWKLKQHLLMVGTVQQLLSGHHLPQHRRAEQAGEHWSESIFLVVPAMKLAAEAVSEPVDKLVLAGGDSPAGIGSAQSSAPVVG